MESSKTIDRIKKRYYFDYTLLFILVFLIGFGLVMLYSSSSYLAANEFGDSAHYLKLQVRNLVIGAVAMAFFIVVDYRKWKSWGWIILIMAFALCVAVYIPGLGRAAKGSSRWLNLGPISFQPSEVAKVAVIFFIAMIIDKIPKYTASLGNIVRMCIPLLPIWGIVGYMNTSTAIIIIGICFCMIFVSSPKYKIFGAVIAFVVIAGLIMISVAGYRMERVQTWLHPENATGDAVYQSMQGLYAIGSGGVFGKGLGQSLQKLGNVPESQNDFIFTIICEELGIFGAVCTIFLYILILWRMMKIANNAADVYGSMLVVGIMAHFAIQVILNIAVVTGSIPNTGVTLPFISYGGTSVCILMAEMGIVLGVSRQIRLDEIK